MVNDIKSPRLIWAKRTPTTCSLQAVDAAVSLFALQTTPKHDTDHTDRSGTELHGGMGGGEWNPVLVSSSGLYSTGFSRIRLRLPNGCFPARAPALLGATCHLG